MNIAIAPHMPIIKNGGYGHVEFENLSLFDLPASATIYVPEGWIEFLYECPGIDYELFSWLISLPVQEVRHNRKAEYLKLNPDILAASDACDRETAKQQLYAIFVVKDARKIYAGIANTVDEFSVTSDKVSATIANFNPAQSSLKELLDSLAPKLMQLKHDKDKHGNVSPFSAYDRHDDDYARQLLRRAYEECPGDVGDRTYLYTYDAKNKTYVEFRPNRNNEYHGMDISRETAIAKCPHIVKLYHK